MSFSLCLDYSSKDGHVSLVSIVMFFVTFHGHPVCRRPLFPGCKCIADGVFHPAGRSRALPYATSFFIFPERVPARNSNIPWMRVRIGFDILTYFHVEHMISGRMASPGNDCFPQVFLTGISSRAGQPRLLLVRFSPLESPGVKSLPRGGKRRRMITES